MTPEKVRLDAVSSRQPKPQLSVVNGVITGLEEDNSKAIVQSQMYPLPTLNKKV